MKKWKKSTGMSLRASIIKWADTLFSLKAILETTMKRCAHTTFCFFNSPWTTKRILCLVMREWPIFSLKKKIFATVTLEMFCTTGTAVKKNALLEKDLGGRFFTLLLLLSLFFRLLQHSAFL